jgi:carbamoyltransferase
MKKKDFIVLSIYEVHMASAAIMINGEVVAATHEERFSRIKMDAGFPYNAAIFCMQQAGIEANDIDVVAIINEKCSPNMVCDILFKRQATYSVQDWVDENNRYWKPKLIEKKQMESFFHIMGGYGRILDQYYDLKNLDMDAGPAEISETFNTIRKDAVERLLCISKKRIVFVPHYLCHHYHAYYSGNMRGRDIAIMHMEGYGGKYNSAVSIPTNSGLKVIGGTDESDLGRLYTWITLLMGMKPYHHEYKLMGLAPYATKSEVEKSLMVFESLFKLDKDKLAIVYNQKPSDLYFYFLEQFRGHRFDGITGALQSILEKWIIEWTKLVVENTECRRICYGGGVAMNVKANMLMSQLDEVDYLYVPISPADESNVIGAGYWLTEKNILQNGGNPDEIPPLQSPYLGARFTRQDVFRALKHYGIKEKFYLHENTNQKLIAKLIAEGWAVATCRGRAEFGQRSLGNRSILANPSQPGIVNKINKQIKYRDFWMPFCPTILMEDQQLYLENPKEIISESMTIAFPVKNSYSSKLQNVIHSGDGTARPQILRREVNPDYYDLIKQFKSITNIGALLNTSFNLHGEPVVNSPEDAINTFLKTDIDAVWLEDILVSRSPVSSEQNK